MVESKSLKLYLFSYRNHGDFHENCVNTIMNDLISLLDPRYIEVWENSCLEADFLLILIAIMEKKILNGKNFYTHRLLQHDLYPKL